MKNRLDSHTHTLASGHAYNTIMEMATAAADKGLELLAVTEHSVKMPGSCNEMYFQNLKVIPRKLAGIDVLFGAELNIVNFDGKVDLREKILRSLDVCIASLHIPCLAPGTEAENTRALIGAIENPFVNILGHPDDGRYPVDFDTVVAAAREHEVLLELNNHSLDPGSSREGAWENDIRMLEMCVKYQAPVILDSDAHWCNDVGNVSRALELIRECGFPEHLIVNDKPEVYKKYINRFRMEQ